MSHRKEQIESTLKRVIAQVLRRQMQDPRISGMVSITKVEVSDDQRQAGIFVSVMPERFENRTLNGLNAAAGYIQSKVIKAVRRRRIPSLRFRLDSSLKKQADILDAIRDAVVRDGQTQAPQDDGQAVADVGPEGETSSSEEAWK